jgi:hypothetical protein
VLTVLPMDSFFATALINGVSATGAQSNSSVSQLAHNV